VLKIAKAVVYKYTPLTEYFNRKASTSTIENQLKRNESLRLLAVEMFTLEI